MAKFRIVIEETDKNKAPYTWISGEYRALSEMLNDIEAGGSEYDVFGIESISLVCESGNTPVRTFCPNR